MTTHAPAARRFARGARCLVAPDGPPEVAGRTVLVLSPDSPDETQFPGAAVVSFDEMPDFIGLVAHAYLRPLEERACLSLDPRCTLLEPCPGCLATLQAHLRDALASASIQGEQGVRFVARWNELRKTAREGVRETVRQAREYVASVSSSLTPMRELAAVQAATVAAEAARTQEGGLGSRDEAPTTPAESSPQPEAAKVTEESAATPEVIHKEEPTKASTRRRASRRNEGLVAAPEAVSVEEPAEEAASGSPGAANVVGPREG